MKCALPFRGIATTPLGTFAPCCQIPFLHTFKGSFTEYWESDYLKNIQNKLLHNEWPSVCMKCKQIEETGSSSLRQDVGLTLDENQKYFDIRFNNLCNQACLMCSSSFSSKIFDECNSVENTMEHYTLLRNFTLSNYTELDINNLLNSIETGSRIEIAGGEPSIQKPVILLLTELIKKGLNKTITFRCLSNFNVLNKNFLELVSNFKGQIIASIDDIGKRLEYIRFGSDWNRIQDNLFVFKEKCKDINIKIQPAIGAYNILTLNQLIKWCNDNDFDISLNNYINYPKYFDCRILPQIVKDTASLVLRNSNNTTKLIKFMNSKETDYRMIDSMKKQLKVNDKNRHICFNDTFPELCKLI